MRFITSKFKNRVRGLAFGISCGLTVGIFVAPLHAQTSGPLDQVKRIEKGFESGRFVGPLDRVANSATSPRKANSQAIRTLTPTEPERVEPMAKQVAYLPPTRGALSQLPQQAFEPQVAFEAFDRPQYESDDAIQYDRPQLDHATAQVAKRMIPDGPVIVPEAFTNTVNASQTPMLTAIPQTSIGSGVQPQYQAPGATIQSVVPSVNQVPSSAVFRGIGYAPAGGQQIDPESRQDILEMETASQLAAQQINDQIHQQYSQGVGEFGDGHGHGDPSFGYVDGAAFGHNQQRLYHPLEGPSTRLMGTPTVATNFGVSCYCDEWDNFCQCRPGLTPCNCGGLKATPGHLGLKWLGSNDNCDQTERPGCRCKKCQTKKCCD